MKKILAYFRHEVVLTVALWCRRGRIPWRAST